MNEQRTPPLRHVLIVKTLIKQYRGAFFERLHEGLLSDGIELTVAYGKPSSGELEKGDNIDLPPSIGRRIPSYSFWGDRLVWQWPGFREIWRADLIIVINANRNLLNLFLLLLSRLGWKKVAFWGHEQNYQRTALRLRDRVKQWLVLLPDWWFAYTEQTASRLKSSGFNPRHLTTINNAIDTSAFAQQVDSVSEMELSSMRDQLGLFEEDRVALYCGSLYAEKRISLLLDAASLIAKKNPRFRLLIVGGGADVAIVRKACELNPFIRYIGPLFGRDKAICYSLSEVVINPGLVGLAILDAFAARRPLITLSDSLHSPEIAYLSHDENGLILDGGVESLADGVMRIINSPEVYARLQGGAFGSSQRYTLEKMIQCVRQGIIDCLQME